MKKQIPYSLSLGGDRVKAGFDAFIFNLKKHGVKKPYREGVTLKEIKSDYEKDYELLYHKAMKTAHLERMFVIFVGAWFELPAINFIENLEPRIIKRSGCNPCKVIYSYRNYEQLAYTLLQNTTDYAKRDFIISYGRNI